MTPTRRSLKTLAAAAAQALTGPSQATVPSFDGWA
jgi:hypothetical protein